MYDSTIVYLLLLYAFHLETVQCGNSKQKTEDFVAVFEAGDIFFLAVPPCLYGYIWSNPPPPHPPPPPYHLMHCIQISTKIVLAGIRCSPLIADQGAD